MRTFVLTGLFTFLIFNTQAQNYKLYNVFMYSFTRYVQWPEEANKGDFEIAVLGDSPIYDELKALAEQKKVGTRTIKVTKVKSVAELKKVHMLFVSSSKLDAMDAVSAKLNKAPTLIITEQAGTKGSGINFFEKAGKLAFELNNASLADHSLRASSELTRIAVLI
ncbi:MAG TPA: YfiR family protein [Cyclobacteriaceae bacterium]